MNGDLIPQSVVRRLAQYLEHVEQLRTDGVEWVSSRELATMLGVTSSTVRQDLSHVDFAGTSRRGYETGGLAGVLAEMLGMGTQWRMVVVGAGNLGRALALHEDFSRRGFEIRGIFDANPEVVGSKVGSLTVLPMEDVRDVIVEHNVDIGVIAVPATAAQEVADKLVASGVRGLLNLSLTHVKAPSSVAVSNSRIVANLLELAYGISFRG